MDCEWDVPEFPFSGEPLGSAGSIGYEDIEGNLGNGGGGDEGETGPEGLPGTGVVVAGIDSDSDTMSEIEFPPGFELKAKFVVAGVFKPGLILPFELESGGMPEVDMRFELEPGLETLFETLPRLVGEVPCVEDPEPFEAESTLVVPVWELANGVFIMSVDFSFELVLIVTLFPHS